MHNYIIYTVDVVITSSGSNAAGANITLGCSVSGTGSNVSASFQWFKGPSNNRTQFTILTDDLITFHSNTSTSQLHISSLRVSHAGTYTCQATVQSIVVERAEIVSINRK